MLADPCKQEEEAEKTKKRPEFETIAHGCLFLQLLGFATVQVML